MNKEIKRSIINNAHILNKWNCGIYIVIKQIKN